jgi:hypothetical protein
MVRIQSDLEIHPALCICITSSSQSACYNIDVLQVGQIINDDSVTNDGKALVDSISASYGPEDIKFQEMLHIFKGAAYPVGVTYVKSTSPGQSEEPIYLCRGGIYELLVPTIDPFLDSPEIVALKRPYCIDGSTKIILSKLYPHSSVRLYFYPLETVNLARGLCGRLPHKRFRGSVLPSE